MKYCIVCGSEIKGQGDKFCQRKCYDKYRVGKKRPPEFAEKIRLKLTGVQHTALRKKNLSLAQIKRHAFSVEEISKIEGVLKEGNTYSLKLILSKAGISPSRHTTLRNYIKSNQEWFDSFGLIKYNSEKCQKWDKQKYEKFLNDSKVLDRREMCIKYDLGKKEYERLCLKFNLPYLKINKRIGYKETIGERKVRFFLEENNITFLQEARINNYKYVHDFIVNNIVIEVYGDFWHVNPMFFDYSNLNTWQKKSLLRHEEKKQWIYDQGYFFYVIWENDLKKDEVNCLNNLKKFINEHNTNN